MPKSLLRKSLQGYFQDEVDIRAHDHPERLAYDTLHLAPAYELLLRRKQAACLDSILVKERERSRLKKTEFAERWKLAQEKIQELDNTLIELDYHYTESGKEQERYVAIVKRQDELKITKMQDITRLEDEKAFLKAVLEETSDRLESFKPVRNYLEKVQEASSGEFKSIRQLFDSYNELSLERAEMTKLDERASSLVAGRQRQLDMLNSTKVNECVILSNDVFELMEALSHLKDQNRELDEDLSHIKFTAAQRAMDLGKVRIACYNLYLQICKKRNKIPRIIASDTIMQLNYINTSMFEMNKLRRVLRRILKEAKDESAKEKLQSIHAAREAYKKQLRTAAKKLDFDDMYGLFLIPREKNWFDNEDAVEMVEKAKAREKSKALLKGKSKRRIIPSSAPTRSPTRKRIN